jgi:GNAT superfamily N-acetyltransferase
MCRRVHEYRLSPAVPLTPDERTARAAHANEQQPDRRRTIRRIEESMRLVTIAERPALRPALEQADAAVYPEFLLHAELARLWPAVYDEFPEYQFALCDEGSGVPLAHGNAVPLAWSGVAHGLPASAESMVQRARAWRLRGGRPSALGALQSVVHPAYRGRGLSRAVLESMAALASEGGISDLFVPIRPTAKPRQPLVDFESYVRLTRGDGLPADASLRVHHRFGARPVCVATRWTTVSGSVADWEWWTGRVFRQSGRHVVPGALVPVEIDLCHDRGSYAEPHLWMHRRLDDRQQRAAA